MPYGIALCYLPPDRGENPAFTPSQSSHLIWRPRRDARLIWPMLRESRPAGIEPMTCKSQVQCPTAKRPCNMLCIVLLFFNWITCCVLTSRYWKYTRNWKSLCSGVSKPRHGHTRYIHWWWGLPAYMLFYWSVFLHMICQFFAAKLYLFYYHLLNCNFLYIFCTWWATLRSIHSIRG